jgi:tRNA (Thr-GGU) A37 N-methylase
MKEITCHPIGYINSPFKEAHNIPIQGCYDDEFEGCCVLSQSYASGLQDLDGFSHAIILYHFHKS